MDKLRVRLVLRRPDEQADAGQPAFLDALVVPARLVWREVEAVDAPEIQESHDV